MRTVDCLVASTEPDTDFARLRLDVSQRIVREYADLLETNAPFPGCIADARQLPHDKAAIKDALTVCLGASQDPELTAELKYAYLQLCMWQDDVGSRSVGVDFTRIDLDADPMAIAELIQQKSAEMGRWRPLVEAEQKRLNRELSELGI